jgi:hypothetical protein
VSSDPPGAAVTVVCGDVTNDSKLVTPAVVTVHRKPEHCTITLSKDGYDAKSVALSRTVSGWYFGNIIFGGVIGLIVDATNGAMYNRSPAGIDVTLRPGGENPTNGSGITQ